MYGFNGQEKDNEKSGLGNTLVFEYRIHDTRLGRFLSVDPLEKEYPWNSTYAFAENDVIRCKDLEGAERFDVIRYYSNTGQLLRSHIHQVSPTPVRADGQFYSRYIYVFLDNTGIEVNRTTWPRDLTPNPLGDYTLGSTTPWFVGFRNISDLQQGIQCQNAYNASPNQQQAHNGITYYPQLNGAGTFPLNVTNSFTPGTQAAAMVQINTLNATLTTGNAPFAAGSALRYRLNLTMPTSRPPGPIGNAFTTGRFTYVQSLFNVANQGDLNQISLFNQPPAVLNWFFTFPDRGNIPTQDLPYDNAEEQTNQDQIR